MARRKRIITIKPKGLVTRDYRHCPCEKLGYGVAPSLTTSPVLAPYANPPAACALNYGEVTQPANTNRIILENTKGGTYLGSAPTNPRVYSRFQKFTSEDFGYPASTNITILGTLPTMLGMYVIVGRVNTSLLYTENKLFIYDQSNCSLSFIRNIYTTAPTTAVLNRKSSLSPSVVAIGDFYDQQTSQHVLTLRNNSQGTTSAFSGSYTRITTDASGTLSQIGVNTTLDRSPDNLRASDGTLQIASGVSYPLNLPAVTLSSGTITQTRIVSSSGTTTLYFGNIALMTCPGAIDASVKGFFNRHNNTHFVTYHVASGTERRFGWVKTNLGSTAIIDQQHSAELLTTSTGSGYQKDARFYAQYGSNTFGDIFMTADHTDRSSSHALLWLQEGKRTFVELPSPFDNFPSSISIPMISCNVHTHPSNRVVSTWYSYGNIATNFVIFAEYTIN